MKLIAYIALVSGLSAIKLSQKHTPVHQKLIKIAHKIKAKQPEGPPHGENELEAWAAGELANGGTITKEEAYNKAVELGVPESMMDELEAGFDAVDADGNGELDAAEVEAAMEHMGIDEDVQFPTEDEIRAWVEAELANDGDITKEEAAGAIAAWADANGVTIPQEAWDIMEAAFDEVDANGDGALTADELAAAFEEGAEGAGAPADRPPRGEGRGPRGGALLKIKSKLKNKLRHKAKQPEGPPHGANELEAWAAGQLADGGTITKEEAYNKAVELGVPESMMDELEAGFDAVDTNGDGELDAAEVEAAMEHMGIDEEVDWPTEQEIKDWVMGHIEADGDLTKEEAAADIAAWADENGVTIPQEAWDILEAGFDEVDANGDGALTIDELAAAFEHAAEEEGAPADRPPRGEGRRGPRGGALLKMKLKSKVKALHKAKQPEGDVEDEVRAWAEGQLADGGTITAQEAHDFAVEMGADEEMLEDLAEGFAMVDTNEDGELDLAEVEAAMAAVEEKEGPRRGRGGPKALLKLKNKIKHRQPEGDVEDEVRAWAEGQLADGGTITAQEAHDFAVEMGADEEMLADLAEGFAMVDTNEDGELDLAEVEAAMAAVEEKEGPRGGRGGRGKALLKLRKH